MGFPRRLRSEPVPWKQDSGAVMFGRRKGGEKVDTRRPAPGDESDAPWATTFEVNYGTARHASDRFSQFNAKPGGPNAHVADAYFTTQNEVGSYVPGGGGAGGAEGEDLGPIAAMVRQRSKNRDANGTAIGAHAGVPRKRLNGPEPGVSPGDIHAVKFDLPASTADDFDDQWPEGHKNRKRYVPRSQAQPVGGKTAPSNASGGGYGAHAGGQFAPDRAARSRDVRSQIEERNADEAPPVKGAFSAALNTFMISHANEGPARDVVARARAAEEQPPLPAATAAALRKRIRGLNIKGFEDF